MSTFLRYTLFGVLVTAAFFLLSWMSRDPQPEHVTGMPWQVTTDSQGRHAVFGITLGRTTLAEARKILIREPQLALFAAADKGPEAARMEAFFDLQPLGTMIARVVLTLGLDGIDVPALIQRAGQREPSSTGEWRYSPALADIAAIDAAPVVGITYVPIYARLDEEMLTARFGQPASVVAEGEGKRRSYPGLGLEIFTDPRGKTVFEYR